MKRLKSMVLAGLVPGLVALSGMGLTALSVLGTRAIADVHPAPVPVPNPQGLPWRPDLHYVVDDGVVHQGSIWRALRSSKGVEPGSETGRHDARCWRWVSKLLEGSK